MNKTHVDVTVRFKGSGSTPFREMIRECNFGFDAAEDTNANVLDEEIVEVEEADGNWFVTVDLLIQHNDNNLDEIIREMDYGFTVSPEHDYEITSTKITNWTITDSR